MAVTLNSINGHTRVIETESVDSEKGAACFVTLFNCRLYSFETNCTSSFSKTCRLIWVPTGFRPTDTGRCDHTISLAIGCVRQHGFSSRVPTTRSALRRLCLVTRASFCEVEWLSVLPRGQACLDHGRTECSLHIVMTACLFALDVGRPCQKCHVCTQTIARNY
jgi:hypothetical protein